MNVVYTGLHYSGDVLSIVFDLSHLFMFQDVKQAGAEAKTEL